MRNLEQGAPFGTDRELDKRYKTRWETVRSLKYKLYAGRLAHQEPNTQSTDALGRIACNWRCGENTSSFQYFSSKNKDLQDALPAVSSFLRVAYVSGVMNNLESALHYKKRDWTFIQLLPKNIDQSANKLGITSEGLQETYTFMAEGYEHAVLSAGIGGVHDVMNTLQKPGLPLLCYGKSEAEQMGLHKTQVGNLMLELPTSIPGVNTRYAYKNGEQAARISIVTRPL